jgi:hypothetical protein
MRHIAIYTVHFPTYHPCLCHALNWIICKLTDTPYNSRNLYLLTATAYVNSVTESNESRENPDQFRFL